MAEGIQSLCSRFKPLVSFLTMALLIASCSAYRIQPINIDGKEVHQLSSGDYAASLKVKHIGTIDNLHLLFRIKKGMVINVRELNLTIDNTRVPIENIKTYYAGNYHTDAFIATKDGTIHVTLEKSTFAGATSLQLMPSNFIVCKNDTLIKKAVQISLTTIAVASKVKTQTKKAITIDSGIVYQKFHSGGTTSGIGYYSIVIDTMQSVNKVAITRTDLDSLGLLLSNVKLKKHFQRKLGPCSYIKLYINAKAHSIAIFDSRFMIDMTKRREYVFTNPNDTVFLSNFLKRNGVLLHMATSERSPQRLLF